MKTTAYNRLSWLPVLCLLFAMVWGASGCVLREVRGFDPDEIPLEEVLFAEGGRFVLEKKIEIKLGSPVRGSLPSDDRHVFAGTEDGRIVSIDASSGAIVWSEQTEETPIRALALQSGILAIASADQLLEGFDPETGALRWQCRLPEGFDPHIQAESGVFVVASQERIVGVDPEGGTVKFVLRTDSPLAAPPLVAGPALYFGTEDGMFHAVDLENQANLWTVDAGAPLTCRPAADKKSVFAGIATNFLVAWKIENGDVDWRYRTGGVILSAPLVDEKSVHVASFDNYLYRLRARTGSQLWRVSVPGRINLPLSGFRDLVIVTSSERGVLFLNIENGSTISGFSTEDRILTLPAIARERVFFGASEDKILILAKRTEQVSKEEEEEALVPGDEEGEETAESGQTVGAAKTP